MLSGLAEAAEALEQGQLETAAALLGKLVQQWGSKVDAPSRLVGPELLLAKQLFTRCQTAAAHRQAELTASISQSATLQRASHAYRSSKR